MSFTIEIDPPLSDRPLKYGRNVMWLSSVILVLAYVPYVELNKFQPLGFDLSEGGEIALISACGITVIPRYLASLSLCPFRRKQGRSNQGRRYEGSAFACFFDF